MASNKHWDADFKEFLATEANPVPPALSEKLFREIEGELQPSFFQVLLKLVLIQASAGGLSLLYCPQFGISLTSSHGLMHYLMQYGEAVCMMGCGALFTGFSLLIASMVLRPEEVRAFRQHRILQAVTLVALSLGGFFCLGAEVASGITLTWALGAIFGGIATLELGWTIRRLSYGRKIS